MRRLEPEADIQRYAPVALFLNGDFFGSYSIRDRYDQWFLSGSYSIDPDDLVFAGRRIGRSGFTLHGDEAIAEEFLEVERFIRSEDLSSPEALAYVERHLDLENYMSYMITGIFLNYTDWGTGKHRRVWRSTGDLSETHPSLDGRWRWLPLDLDGTFVRGGPVDQNHLRDIIESRRYLLTFLLENEAFEERFRQRFEEALGTELHPERTALLLEDYVAHISPGLRSDHDRLYGIASEAWDGHVEGLREFLTQRPDEVRRHLEEFFG